MTSAKNPNIKTLKYKVSATITKLRLCTKSPLNLKIQWKRNDTSTETPLTTHKNQSSFNTPLTLQFNMYYDQVKGEFMEKKTDFNVIIERDGVIKSGGYVRIDLAEYLNKEKSLKIELNKCPDSSAFLEFVLNFELSSKQESGNISIDMSMNRSSFNLASSQSSISNSSNFLSDNLFQTSKPQNNINKPTKDKPQPQKQLTTVIDKFQSLLTRIKSGNRTKYLDRSNTSSARGEKQELNDKIQQLQYKNRTLEKQVDKKSTEILDKTKEISRLKDKVKDLEDKVEIPMFDNYQYKFRELEERYQKQGEELEELKEGEEVRKGLEEEKWELQDQIAKISRNMGNLFDAAYEIGGAKLLDKLQAAIGLVENT